MQTFRRNRAPMGRDFEYQPLPKSQDDIEFLNKTLEEKRKAQEQAHNIYFHLDNIQENLAQIVKRAQKGYMVERDLLYMIQMTVECVMLIVKGGCERDPISKTPYQFVGLTLKIQGALLNAYHRNVAPEDPNTLTGRLSNIFECVVKRCFGNIRNLDGYIWTGSTSEGFALTDYSEGSEIRLDDEMDIMVPIATIAEGSRGGQMCDEIPDILVQTKCPQVEGGAHIGLTLNFIESQQFHDNSCQKSKDEQISMITENSSSTDSHDEGKVQTPCKESATLNTQRSEVCDVTGKEGEKTPECSVESAVAVSTAKGDVNEETCTRRIDMNMSNQQSGSENNDNSLVKAFETAAQLSPTDEPLRNPKPWDKAGSDLYFGASAPENADRKAKPKGLERYISELEEVGTRQPRKHPAFIWVKASHPGYVKVQIPANRKKLFSEGLIRHLCSVENEGGEEVIYLSRIKLLKIQEAFVRSEIPSVQYCIDVLPPVWGENRGTLEVVQQGPVQTLCLHHHLKSREALTGGNYTTAEFDQTIDVALVLSCIAWPSEAQEWISRARQWPSSDIVQRIVREGCHVVPKAYPGEEDKEELQWRLSFSLAERTLANTFMPWQRTTYLVLKKLWRRHFKEPKVISSYYLKTTMFWVSEKITPNQWQENNIVGFISKLLVLSSGS
ncbi:uncharacterized protein [Ptychodera flava]|uniref:uncharacterized protein n=1 Tax=Ptychodera flava TaxID=63121 RepID=UPI00396A6CC5